MGWHRRPVRDDRLTTRKRATRRWWRSVTAVATAVALLIAGMPPANAAWAEEWWLPRLDVNKAWTVSKGAGVTVAVVDTGVVDKLGDLSGRVLPGVNLVGGGDGRSDPGDGCNESGGCYSHGTQMALLIAGTAAGQGFQGIAPAAKILPVKVISRTGLDADDGPIAQGVKWSVDHGAKIVSISLGTSGSCPDEVGAAIKYAYQHDVIVVAGSGNDSSPVMGNIAACPGALAVGATNPQFTRASFSNYGPQLAFVDPGTPNVQETLSGAKLPGGDNSGGTSDATAIAAASLALIRSHFPHMSARDVVTHALYNVHNGLGKFGVRISDQLGYGEILPYHAMADALPAGASNPIYDQWAKELGPPTPGGGSSGSSAAPSSGSDEQPSSEPASGGGQANGSSGSGSSGIPVGVIILIVVVVIAAGVSVAVVVRRSKRSSTVGGYPPPR